MLKSEYVHWRKGRKGELDRGLHGRMYRGVELHGMDTAVWKRQVKESTMEVKLEKRLRIGSWRTLNV